MNRKRLNELDWRTLLWEDAPTATLDVAGGGNPAGGSVVDEDDGHHGRRRRERRIDPLHRPMQVTA